MSRKLVVYTEAKCDLCEKILDDVQEPLQWTWMGKEYEVDLCEGDLTNIDMVAFGTLLHSSRPRMHPCPAPGCGQEFKTKQGLSKHSNVHKKEESK